jgi:hypothetical protein
MKDRPPRGTRFRWFLWIRRVLYGLTIFVAWKLAWRWYDIHKATKEYEKAAAELDKSDPGWRWEEIEEKRETVPAEKNGAERILAAAKLLPKDWPAQPIAARSPLAADSTTSTPAAAESMPTLSDRVTELDPNYQLPEDIAGELRAELSALSRPLEVARSVADLPDGRYAPVRLAQSPINTLVPHLVHARTVAALLHFDAILRAQEENPDAACNSVVAQLNAARSVGDEPFLLASIVRARVVTKAVESLERTIGQGELSRVASRRLDAALLREEKESLPTLLCGLRGERAMHDITLQRVADGDVSLDEFAGPLGNRNPSLYDRLVSWYAAPPLAAGNRATMLRHMTEMTQLAQLPRGQRRQRVAEVEADLRSKKGDRKYIFYTLLSPAISRVFDVRDRQLASIRCARTALAAEQFRVTHKGRWPQTIEQLVPNFLPEVPIDPFTDDPLEMEEHDGVLIISSVGSDGLADDPLLNPRRMKPADPAIRFRLWKPESRGLPSG